VRRMERREGEGPTGRAVPVVSVADVVAVVAVYSQPVSCNKVSNSLGSSCWASNSGAFRTKACLFWPRIHLAELIEICLSVSPPSPPPPLGPGRKEQRCLAEARHAHADAGARQLLSQTGNRQSKPALRCPPNHRHGRTAAATAASVPPDTSLRGPHDCLLQLASLAGAAIAHDASVIHLTCASNLDSNGRHAPVLAANCTRSGLRGLRDIHSTVPARV
jgi:hypothetical protein